MSPLTAGALLGRGYLPRELPPVVSSEQFGKAASKLTLSPDRERKWSSPTRFSIVRPGGLRRTLSIPNPAAQFSVAHTVISEWRKYATHCSASPFALSTPRYRRGRSQRALAPTSPFFNKPQERLRRRRSARVVLHADIAQFYQSIYTHSIPWALNGKDATKTALKDGKTHSLLGDRLDKAVRRGRDGQTIGIPIGPDTSLLVAEIVLSAVDAAIASDPTLSISGGLRYVDDFELYFRTRAAAEEALGHLEAQLQHYELSLNANKTYVGDMPLDLEALWRSRLSTTPIRTMSDATLANDLVAFFNLAFELRRNYPNDPVISYAIQRARSFRLNKRSARVVHDVALSAIQVESAAFPYACSALIDLQRQGLGIDVEAVEEVLNLQAAEHSALEHSYEVVWALWALGGLGLTLRKQAARQVSAMSDNVSLLVYLWLRELSQVENPEFPQRVETLDGSKVAGTSEDWLLAYECTRWGWLDVPGINDDPFLSQLLNAGVSFLKGFAVPVHGRTSIRIGVTEKAPPASRSLEPDSPEIGEPDTPEIREATDKAEEPTGETTARREPKAKDDTSPQEDGDDEPWVSDPPIAGSEVY